MLLSPNNEYMKWFLLKNECDFLVKRNQDEIYRKEVKEDIVASDTKIALVFI